jgi:phosphate transport system substrate-binding protein
MTALKWILGISCAAAPALLGWQTAKATGAKHIYVESFATKQGSDKLREAVIAELRKQASVSLVSDEASADVILGGGGEIWIKGYKSLNPRSGRMPSNGTPIYAGYLSVELRDTKGDTLWGDLVTPSAGAEDISKDLAKRIAKHATEALEKGLIADPSPSLPQPTTVLTGAGATFPYPVYQKWFTNYRRQNPNVQIVYEPVGSEAGVRALLKGNVDFGASDNPEAVRELDGLESKYLLFPSVVGAVVPIVNVPGVQGEIQFTAEALAGIYLGQIKKWSDPILARVNKGLHLPDLDIVVVHRKDGSGTSYAWTDFLSKTSPEWKDQVGCTMTPKWPVGRSANGNDGVAKEVKEFGGSIGYVEFIYALDNHLSYGKIRNRSGEFVEASLESLAAAVSGFEVRDDFKISIVNAPGTGAYPIASFTWLVAPAQISEEAKRTAVMGFLKWMLGPGQAQAAALGYLALPKDLVAKEYAAIGRIR